jgi:hypothetical protein
MTARIVTAEGWVIDSVAERELAGYALVGGLRDD